MNSFGEIYWKDLIREIRVQNLSASAFLDTGSISWNTQMTRMNDYSKP